MDDITYELPLMDAGDGTVIYRRDGLVSCGHRVEEDLPPWIELI